MRVILLSWMCLLLSSAYSQVPTFRLPGESQPHAGTWLQWPHQYTYGLTYRNRLDQTFLDMTAALVPTEQVYIIAYNTAEKNRIIDLLNTAAVPLGNIFFYIIKTDDVWSRDNGPMYVYNASNELVILDWKFDGWGNDTPYSLDDKVPQRIANKTGTTRINLSTMVLEGGAVEVDGAGTFLATRSSIMGDNRNPTLSESDINFYLTQYLGVNNIIWLDGIYGAGFDITDTHIDGFARLKDSITLVTMNEANLNYWGISSSDIDILMNATNAYGTPYNQVFLPLTNKNVKTTWGANVGFKSSYNNYYVANEVVLATTFNDANDDDAIAILQSIYPDKEVIGIDSRNLYYYGGMIHCVTQQQPDDIPLRPGIQFTTGDSIDIAIQLIFPNPASQYIHLQISGSTCDMAVAEIYNQEGKLVAAQAVQLMKGETILQLDVHHLPTGTYYAVLNTHVHRTSAKSFDIIR